MKVSGVLPAPLSPFVANLPQLRYLTDYSACAIIVIVKKGGEYGQQELPRVWIPKRDNGPA